MANYQLLWAFRVVVNLGIEWELRLTVQETRLSDGRDGREVMVVVVVGVLVVVMVVCWKIYQLISGWPSAVIWCGKQFKIIGKIRMLGRWGQRSGGWEQGTNTLKTTKDRKELKICRVLQTACTHKFCDSVTSFKISFSRKFSRFPCVATEQSGTHAQILKW